LSRSWPCCFPRFIAKATRRGYESLDKEIQHIVHVTEVGRRFVDKLVRVWTNDDIECWVLIRVELKTAREAGPGDGGGAEVDR
jgi:hypothetical protein